ncbi:MAG TPA: hypothetical protein VME69_15195 [Methylocella sp.]|nr:hypothetical protein [Methylocella sp.]
MSEKPDQNVSRETFLSGHGAEADDSARQGKVQVSVSALLPVRTLASSDADLIAFGKPFIASPDLVERLRRNAPLNLPRANSAKVDRLLRL